MSGQDICFSRCSNFSTEKLLFFSMKTEKVDLENTLVDESQRQSKEYGCASISRNEKCSGMVYCIIIYHSVTYTYFSNLAICLLGGYFKFLMHSPFWYQILYVICQIYPFVSEMKLKLIQCCVLVQSSIDSPIEKHTLSN